MNAIIPLNVTALRVNANDNSNISGSFAGPMAAFDKMPYQIGDPDASTGDTIFRSLDQSTSQNLNVGIHLHWELPDYFQRGVQANDGGAIVFPHTPNRWVVVRYFSAWDDQNQRYQAPSAKAWVVLSDAISDQPDTSAIPRTRVTVPLPVNPPPAPGAPPFKYMGLVADYESWDPNDTSQDVLSNYKDEDGNPYYLTSIGFVGPGFSAYYPECCSVFGFIDHFGDLPDVRNAMLNNTVPNFSKFKVSYQVIGWIDKAQYDPLQVAPGIRDAQNNSVTFLQAIENQYADTLKQYVAKGANLDTMPTPDQVFADLANTLYQWAFPPGSLVYTLNPDKSIQSADGPARVLCNGLMQEIAWDFEQANKGQAFLSTPSGGAVWTDTVRVAVGNTPTEALSAMLKADIGQTDDPQDLSNNEYLLDTLQLGLLRDLEQDSPGSFLFNLDEALHSRAFGRQSGGLLWIVKQKRQGDPANNSQYSDEATLPMDLAEKLNALNQAQKAYDQGRAELDLRRRQLFMDWFRFMKTQNSPVSFYENQLPNFIDPGNGGELQTVVQAGKTVGILQYQLDPATGQILAPQQPAAGSVNAQAVWNTFQTLQTALALLPNFELASVPAPNFWLPTDPTVLVQGDRVEPARRNGPGPLTNTRVTPDLITVLGINGILVNASALGGLPALNANQPLSADVAALLGEAGFLMPALAWSVGAALKALGGSNNPATGDMNAFAAALQSAQGDWTTGFFSTVHSENYQAVKNPTASSGAGITPALTLIFTNTQNAAWTPDPVAWNAQKALPEFSTPQMTRLDPFIPMFLTWSANIDPLTRDVAPPFDPSCKRSDGGGGSGDYQAPNTYGPDNLTRYFRLDSEAVDNVYQPGTTFTTQNPVLYTGSATLSQTAAYSLTAQIQRYIDDNPNDTAINKRLSELMTAYQNQKMLSQALSGFNSQQILRKMIPQIALQDLTAPPGSDTITSDIQAAATGNAADNWYDYAFNSEQPIPGDQATANFGPLRAGFMTIMEMRFVDVFGQLLQMQTANPDPDNLQVIPSERLKPMSGDTANAGKVYLAPRLLMPSRLWFRWLSAAHNTDLTADFVEMNAHPATSPVCGWMLPNHLDNSLMFYNADGTPIGSFGLEHGVSVYRSRPGVLGDDLVKDIGAQGSPAAGINPHVANFMWFVQNKKTGPTDGAFLGDFIYAIENSDQFIHAAAYKQASGLAVLMGRPLAITRAVASLESYGAAAPLSQADTSTCDPFHQDVLNNRFDYKTREQFSSGGIEAVRFPMLLGDLANIDDGLVGFLLENSDGSYQNGMLYSPAAALPASSPNHGVAQPTNNPIQLKLNDSAQTLTVLMDPRCPVHATTGILPVAELSIPPDQYAQTMRSLGVTFFTHPVLEKSSGLVVPLPKEAGYGWSWIELDGLPTTTNPPTISPLKDQAANEYAYASYSPQTILEGWLGLAPLPPLDLDKNGGS